MTTVPVGTESGNRPLLSVAVDWPEETTLFREHRDELAASAISPAVAAARKYRTLARPSLNDDRARPELERAHIPGWAYREDRYFPMLVIPRYSPAGAFDGITVKPRTAVKDRDGRSMKYAHPKGAANTLDVHPFNRDRIADVSVPLFVTEGVKKADALTTAGYCAAAVNGVYGWRRTDGAEAVWESVPVKGRQVVLCFDSDTNERLDLQRAVRRLGAFLKHKGATVHYLVLPSVNAPLKTGIDDWLASGRRVDELEQVSSLTPPMADEEGHFTDVKLTDHFAERVLYDEYRHAVGLGWLYWDGRRWEPVDDGRPRETLRAAVRDEFDAMLDAAKQNPAKLLVAGQFRRVLSANRLNGIMGLLTNHSLLRVEPDQLDAWPELLNTPGGVVNLRTGEIGPHDPALLLTKITKGNYRPGFEHPDWTAASGALPEDVWRYLQLRIGQAATGYIPESDDCLVLIGNGANGKSLATSDGVMRALGDYAMLASPGLVLSKDTSGGATPERASVRGARFVLVEELPEGRSLSIEEIKRIVGTSQITARMLYQNEMTFTASHTLFVTTNYLPSVNETDDGAWRRLCPINFPFKFVPGEPDGADQRRGDSGLKTRVRAGLDGQHDAIVTWIAEGARQYLEHVGWIMQDQRPVAVVHEWRKWRAQADRVFSYLAERVRKDEGSAVAMSDLYSDFAQWLADSGYAKWGKETFFKRLEGHESWRAMNTTAMQTMRTDFLSRPPAPPGSSWSSSTSPALPSRPRVFTGIRFIGKDE